MVLPVSIFSACSTSIIDFGTIFRLCPMNGGGLFHCIPDVDDDCISDSQVMMTHGAVVFKCFPSTAIRIISTKVYRNGRKSSVCPYTFVELRIVWKV